MSWLNFNDSLNNIKGQLSNFANTVLADETLEDKNGEVNLQDPEKKRENNSKVVHKNLGVVQGPILEDLAIKNDFNSGNSWSWSTDESKTDQLKTDETITNLKKRIVELENENRDLITSLDQLDQNHQQNTEELVKIKGKLSEELEIVTEKYEVLNMKFNKLALAENAYKKKIIELKKKCEELSNQKEGRRDDDTELLSKYKQLENDKIQLNEKLITLDNENKNLEILLQDTNAAIDTKLSQMSSTIQQLDTENKALRIAIQSKTELSTSNDEHRKILDDYETKIKELEDEIHKIKTTYSSNDTEMDICKQLKEYERLIKNLENDVEDRKKKEVQMMHRCEELEKLKSNIEEKTSEDKEKMKSKFEEQLKVFELKLSNLKQLDDQNEQEKQSNSIMEVHKKYFQILCNNFREYFDDNVLTDEFANDELFIAKFTDRLKNLSNIITEFETKCNSLESKLFELNQNKTDLQNEKNEEIEKLLQNSEMLTQEVLKKSKEIKDLEEECSQLMKNNDLLISRLEESKETGLQTIFESNEDSAALWEKQLEAANKKIHELEQVLSDNVNKNVKTDSADTVVEESDTSAERSQKFIELQEHVNKVKEENESFQLIIEDLKYKLDETEKERNHCRLVIDKMKSDFETTEYQFSEMNINLETLSEEIEKHKAKIDLLQTENENLKSLGTERTNNEKEIELIERELKIANEQNKNLQKMLENTEKELNIELQKTKMELNMLQTDIEVGSKEKQELKKEIENLSNRLIQVRENFEKSQTQNATLMKGYSSICDNLNIESRGYEDEFEITGILERLGSFRNEIENLKRKNNGLVSELNKVKKFENENIALINFCSKICEILNLQQFDMHENDSEILNVLAEISNLKDRVDSFEAENARLNAELTQYQNKLATSQSNEDARKELQDLMASRNELIAIVQTKHQETLTYHAEIQRLSEVLQQEMEKNGQLTNQINELKKSSCSEEVLKAKDELIEKLTDQKSFLEEKCDVLARNMLEEQRKLENDKLMSSEKEAALSKKLERLQSHLMEVEEHYTQELLGSEQKIALLQARLNEIERREKESSTIYTSVSIRANQQNEALQQQLQSMTQQRDEFKKKMMELDDENNVNSAALSNLQLVLEQFQRDKEADVIRETDRIRRQVKQEQKVQEDLKKEISKLEAQIRESKQGLQAALRLTDQLEVSKNQISTLKEEVTALTDKLSKKDEELKTVTSQTDGKVDKSLVKNLIIGFITANKNLNKDQLQILKIIATVLDFNEQEHSKVNLNQAQQNSWLSSLLKPVGGEEIPPHESLSRAFVNFLENESKPRIIPSLLPANSPPNDHSITSNSSRTTPSPIVLNEIVLPTFSDFPQHRNSSSILKGVLKDNS